MNKLIVYILFLAFLIMYEMITSADNIGSFIAMAATHEPNYKHLNARTSTSENARRPKSRQPQLVTPPQPSRGSSPRISDSPPPPPPPPSHGHPHT